MAYTEIEQLTLDINWYFVDHYNRICIAASAGGLLPKPIAENNEGNEEFHKLVSDLPLRFEVARNENILSLLQGIESQDIETYFQDFDKLASRGLYVYDKVKLDNPEDGFYILVVYPIYNTENDSYPMDKKKLLLIPRTKQAIISRRFQKVNRVSFNPINLTMILNNQNLKNGKS